MFMSSCIGHGDGIIQEQEINLRIVSADKNQYEVYIKMDKVNNEKIKSEKGIYKFKTPKLWFSEGRIFGIPMRRHVNDIDDFFQLKAGNKIIMQLSCEALWDLPKDKDGLSFLEI